MGFLTYFGYTSAIDLEVRHLEITHLKISKIDESSTPIGSKNKPPISIISISAMHTNATIGNTTTGIPITLKITKTIITATIMYSS